MAKATAAESLAGLALENGWIVEKRFVKHDGATGGQFSEAYIARKEDKRAFLKAIDLSGVMEHDNPALMLQQLTDAYLNEREILVRCKDRRFSRVVVAIDHGRIQVPGFDGPSGLVLYLIFELAESDVRSQVSIESRLDTVVSLGVLRDVALGLFQVHGDLIAHQDIKPSNVLHYASNNSFRIADFGRASSRGRPVYHDEFHVAGDRRYAPFEQLYEFSHPDFTIRRIGCDLYMLGNLTAFMFSGMNVTSQVISRCDPAFHPRVWGGSYDEVLPYLQSAFAETIAELGPLVDAEVRTEVVSIVRQLCTPDYRKRGHPRSIGTHTQYSVQRYVSAFERIEASVRAAHRMGRRRA